MARFEKSVSQTNLFYKNSVNQITQQQENSADFLCGICLDDTNKQVPRLALNCSHTFHTGCASQWFTEGALTCPYCKGEIDLSQEKFKTLTAIADRVLREESFSDMRSNILTSIGEIAVRTNKPYVKLSNKQLEPYELFSKSLRINPNNRRAAADLAMTWPEEKATLKVKNPLSGQWSQMAFKDFVKCASEINPDNNELKSFVF